MKFEADAQKLLVLLVVILGHLATFGNLVNIPGLRGTALFTASSPYPIVFHYEEIAASIELDVFGKQGETQQISFGAGTGRFSQIEGPITRVAPYMMPIFAELQQVQWHAVYSYALCQESPVSQELQVFFPIDQAHFRISYRAPEFPQERTMKVQCP